MKSFFDSDYKAANELGVFLDAFFYPNFCELYNNNFLFHRITDYDIDYKGIDILCTTKKGRTIPFDEKATLDYITGDRPLSTFAFELGFMKDGRFIEGWLTNDDKLTEGYVLIWPHGWFDHEKGLQLELAEIMLIRRSLLLEILANDYGFTVDRLRNEAIDVVRNNNHDNGYLLDHYGRYTGKISSNRMIKFVHSTQKKERPKHSN